MKRAAKRAAKKKATIQLSQDSLNVNLAESS